MVFADFGIVDRFLDVEPDVLGLVKWLCTDRKLNVFVPLRHDGSSS